MIGLTMTSSDQLSPVDGTNHQHGRAPDGEKGAEATIARLQTEIGRVLDPELEGISAVALVDFPNHGNVGDSAIYLGELEWLRRHDLYPRYVSTVWNFSAEALQRAVPEGPILIHGGGNFGDIWEDHQEFRETLMTVFSDRRIVQLPQTIHFDNVAARDRAAKRIAAHGNVLLLVRDRTSLEIARGAFESEVRLCPDMALMLGPQPDPSEAKYNLLLLLRTDREKVNRDPLPPLPDGAFACDWLDEPRGLRIRLLARTLYHGAIAAPARNLDRNYRRDQLYRALAAHRVARGLRLLASGRTVITDRLHGHVMSLLLGIPHIVCDNNYGKLGSFIETWTGECGLVARAASPAEALGREGEAQVVADGGSCPRG
jgi:exopolysaccharide biosynthesis predicted pyruvyltransferase EpsI